MAQAFGVVAENPNDLHGGGGCLCSEMQPRDRGPEYVVFNCSEMFNTSSPIPVLCTQCLPVIDKLVALYHKENPAKPDRDAVEGL